MLSYETLQDRPLDLLAITGLKREEFLRLLPAFEAAYEKCYTRALTQEGKPRKRRIGGGVKGALHHSADKLLFILVYQKTNPLQTVQALQFGMSQPQANYWIHRLLPVLHHAMAHLGMKPARDTRRVMVHRLTWASTADLTIHGTKHRRQRPAAATKQQKHDSNPKKTQTDNNMLLVNVPLRQASSLSPAVPGKRRDNKAVHHAQLAYPVHVSLDQDTDVPGYELESTLTGQHRKGRRAKR